MFDFFDEFFQSEFAKNHTLAIVMIGVLAFIIGFFIGWVYLKFIHYKVKFNKMEKINELNTDLEAENADLKNIISVLKKENSVLKTKIKKQSFSDNIRDYKINKEKIDDAIMSLIE